MAPHEPPPLPRADPRDAEVARSAALAAVQARSQLIERLGCDVRRPLAALRESLGELEHAPQGDRRERLDRVQAACEALIVQVDELLSAASLHATDRPGGRVVFDLRGAVSLVRESLAPLARARGVAWQTRVAEAVPEVLVGDAAMLRQALLLLCERGLRQCGAAGVELAVDARPDVEGEVQLRFALAAPGAPAGGRAEAPEDGDLELGLCAQLARLLDGQLRVLRARGGAWSAELRMRADVAPERRSRARRRGAGRPKMRPLCVLLASDSPPLKRVVTQVLAGQGHSVVALEGGVEATAALPDERYQLLLVDRDLGDLDGASTLRVVRARELHAGGRIPAILLCSPGQELEQRLLLDAGADACVPKPIDEEALLWAVARVCGPPADPVSD